MTTDNLTADLERDEGYAKALPNGDCEAYPDPLSPLALAIHDGEPTEGLSGDPWTIGFGQTGPGIQHGTVWTRAHAESALELSIAIATRALDADLPWWRNLDDVRQDVLANMCFNLGIGRLEGFHHTLAAVKAGNWQAAHEGMLASAWARQVGDRAVRLAKQMLTGEHQT